MRIAVFIAAALALGCVAPSPQATKSTTVPELVIDLHRNPNLYFRIDSFSIPDAARDEFQAAMQTNMEFIRTLPGFCGHVVFVRRDGDESVDLVTIAAWESREAMELAKSEVMAYYRRIGFDMPAMLRRWGVTMVRVDAEAPVGLQ